MFMGFHIDWKVKDSYKKNLKNEMNDPMKAFIF